MANSVDLDGTAVGWDLDTAHTTERGDFPAGTQYAQSAGEEAASTSAQEMEVSAPEAEPVPIDAASGEAAAPAAVNDPASGGTEYTADANNIVHLPANTSVDNIRVENGNLVLEQADGTLIVIRDAAANVPTFMIGDVELPRIALLAALEAGGVDVAFGADGSISAAPGVTTPNSSGGEFEQPRGDIGNGFDLTALLPPTALAFPQYDGEELYASVNADPLFENFSITISEEGLEDGNRDDNGFADTTDFAVITGTFGASDPNGDQLTYRMGLPDALVNSGVSSGGNPVTWELVSTTVLEGRADGETVIRITITDAGTGAYKVELVGPFDHPDAGVEDNLPIVVPVIAEDPLGGSATAQMTIIVEDDSPEISTVRLGTSVILDETTARPPEGFGSSGITETSAAPILDYTSTFGADGPAAAESVVYALSITNGAGTALKTAIGDFPITLQQINSTTISGTYNGGADVAFTITINNDGTLTVTQHVPLEHADPADDDDQLSLSGKIRAEVTVTDFDGDEVFGGAQIGGSVIFKDDGPSIEGAAIGITIDEDDIETAGWTADEPGSTGSDPDDGNCDGSFTGAAGEDTGGAANASGSLASKVNFGADGPAAGGGFGFTSDAAATFALIGLRSAGIALSYVVEGNTITAFADDGSGTYTAGADRKVFTFELDPETGDFKFSQFDQLDHVSPSAGGADENTSLVSAGGSVPFIDMGSVIRATDSDGDSVDLDGQLNITITDDVPVLTGLTETKIVNEDDILTLNSLGSSPHPSSEADEENDGDDSYTEHSIGPAFTSGSLAGLVASGADESLTFGFSANALQYLANLGLYSKQSATGDGENGKSLSYRLSSDGRTITAWEPNPQGNKVFELKLDPVTGAYEFRLYDELVHEAPAPGTSDENTNLRSGDGTVDGISFGSIIEARDSDGDAVLLGDAFKIVILDDVPTARIALTGAVVIHDETPGDDGYHDTNSAAVAALFDGVERIGDDPDVPGDVIGFARNAFSIVRNLSTPGADAPGYPSTFTLSIAFEGVDSGLRTTEGDAILLYNEGGIIVGRVGGETGDAAFAVHIDNDGRVSVAQYLSLQHDDVNDHDEWNDNGGHLTDHGAVNETTNPIQQTLDGKITATLTVTDSDGDTSTASVDIGGQIRFEDDGPSVDVRTDVSPAERAALRLELDETIGADRYNGSEPQDNNGAMDDAQDASLPIEPKTAPASGDAIGSKTTEISGGLAALFRVADDYGADGPRANQPASARTDALSFNVTGSGKTNIVVTALEGTALEALSDADRTVYLVEVSAGVVEGRIHGANGVAGGNDDFVAFRITITDPGNPSASQITVEQFLAVDHGGTESPSVFDEQIDMLLHRQSTLKLVLETKITDGDGDYDSDSASVTLIDRNGSFISIDDDGPVVNSVTNDSGPGEELIVNGSFEHLPANTLGTSDWEIFHAIPGWTSTSIEGVPFEIQTGSVGGMQAQEGDALVELDSDLSGNPNNDKVDDINSTGSTNATIQQVIPGTVAGQAYELSFYYSPRGGSGTDSSGMKVMFGGEVVYEIPAEANGRSTGSWHHITLTVVADGPDSVLAFIGTGSENANGAFLDNVSLKASYGNILDDEDLDGGIQGGPGDDGAGTILSGRIDFDAGTDGLKSIVADGIDGLKAIYVGSDGSATQYMVSQNWVANGAGGTLTGSMDVAGIGPVDVYKLVINEDGTYNFKLLRPLVHAEHDDPDTTDVADEDNLELEFGFVITDGDGDAATGEIVIYVDDDVPVASDDDNSLREDAASVSGDVLANDLAGADGGKTVTTPGTYTGTFGQLVLNVDGSYTYTLKTDAATQAVIQALGEGDTLSDSFDYTMRDGDFDTDSAKLVITIEGADDGVTITGLGVNGGEQTVYEADLPAGSSSDTAALTQSGTFAISAPDGIATIEIGSQTFSYAQLSGATVADPLVIDSPQGVLKITGYSGTVAGGTVSYSYTLDTTVANAPGASQSSESFAVVVTDTDGSDSTASLDITIIDDVPQAKEGDVLVVSEVDGVRSGQNLLANDVKGADGAKVTAVSFDGGDTWHDVGPSGLSIGGPQGAYVFQQNGDWTFDPSVNACISDQDVAFEYRITDGDNDSSEAIQKITIENAFAKLVVGAASGVVEEEHLQPSISGSYPVKSTGNEDTDDFNGLDTDESGDFGEISNVWQGTFNNGVSGNEGALTFSFTSVTTGTAVTKTGGVPLTSDGDAVRFHFDGSKLLGYVSADATTSDYVAGADRVVFTVELTHTATGAYTFTLYDKVDHHVVGDDVEDTIDIDLGGRVQVEDGGQPGDVAVVESAVITVIDDIPIAENDTNTAMVGSTVPVDAVFVVDLSPSMYAERVGASAQVGFDVPGYNLTDYGLHPSPGWETEHFIDLTDEGGDDRISLARYSLELLLQQNPQLENVQIVQFGGTTRTPVWMTRAEALAFVQDDAKWTPIESTNYDAALQEVMDSYSLSRPGSPNDTLIYFLSDGDPSGSGNIDNNGAGNQVSEAEWHDFVANPANQITDVFAVGLGNNVNTSSLNPVAYPDTGNVMVVDSSDLNAFLKTLQAFLNSGEEVQGNVVSNDSPGADGVGYVESIEIGGVLYAFNGSSVTKDGQAFDSVNGVVNIDIDAPVGGKLVFNFLTGEYKYLAPDSGSGGTLSIDYVLVDGDGDGAKANLTIEVVAPSLPNAISSSVTVDEDDLRTTFGALHNGVGNNDSPGDAVTDNPTPISMGDYGTDGRGSNGVSFNVSNDALVKDVDGHNVERDGVPLKYFWDSATNTLYGTTDTANSANAAANASFKIVINQDNASYDFTLLKHVDHDTVGTEDDIDLDIGFTITDANGDTATSTISVTIDDDMPVATSNDRTVDAGYIQTVDVRLVVDMSGSMGPETSPGWGGGPIGFNSPPYTNDRIGLARYSLEKFLNDNPQVENVQIVRFAQTADTNAQWMTREEAQAFIADASNWTIATTSNSNPLGLGSATYYSAAIQAVLDQFDSNSAAGPSSPSDQSLVYFITDGNPSTSSNNSPVSAAQQTEWETLINSGTIDAAYAVAFGNTVNEQYLTPIAHPSDDGVVLIPAAANADSLSNTLSDLLAPGSVYGNILTNDPSTTSGSDALGADGGYVQSITIDGVTYTFDGTGTISESGTTPAGYADHGTWIEVKTALGGTLTFDFATSSHGSVGDWSYLAPDTIANPSAEQNFAYTIIDGDGDTASASLNITVVQPDDASPSARVAGFGLETFDDAGLMQVGGDGDDILEGIAGQVDTLIGGAGADTFVINDLSAVDIIADYNMSEGDVVDLSSLLDANFGAGDDEGNFVRVLEDGGDAILQVDIDGASGGEDFVDVAVLQNFNTAADTVRVLFNDSEHDIAPPPVA